MTYDAYLKILNSFHKERAGRVIEHVSPLAGDAFPGEFNVSGFHKEILDLPTNPQSLWGVDTCLRIQEKVSDYHTHLFHMGIYAKSIDLQSNFVDPLKDERYQNLQEDTFNQLFELLSQLGVGFSDLEATVAGEIKVGGPQQGRDSKLGRSYLLGPDTHAEEILKKKGVAVATVSGLANVDIHPEDAALVGLRCELAYKGVEIATIVFNTFKINATRLEPINYIGGYALGVERIYALLQVETIATSTPRYLKASSILTESNPSLSSNLLKEQHLQILYGLEVLAALPLKGVYSNHQKQHLRRLSNQINETARELGIDESVLQEVFHSYKNE